jgi:hypothetical protein
MTKCVLFIEKLFVLKILIDNDCFRAKHLYTRQYGRATKM